MQRGDTAEDKARMRRFNETTDFLMNWKEFLKVNS
jgi:hypothetical protein